MKRPEVQIIRFDAKDTIATSLPVIPIEDCITGTNHGQIVRAYETESGDLKYVYYGYQYKNGFWKRYSVDFLDSLELPASYLPANIQVGDWFIIENPRPYQICNFNHPIAQ